MVHTKQFSIQKNPSIETTVNFAYKLLGRGTDAVACDISGESTDPRIEFEVDHTGIR
jgi:hypothetical protein